MYRLFVEGSWERPTHAAAVKSFLETVNKSLAALVSLKNPPGVLHYCSSLAAPLGQLLNDASICRVRRVHLAMEAGTCIALSPRLIPRINVSLTLCTPEIS